MHLVTICTDNWIDSELKRWIRKVEENSPSSKTCLILATNTRDLCAHSETVAKFDMVKTFSGAVATRPWFNEVRMGATELFGIEECVYIDADADVLESLEEIPGDKSLRWVETPQMHTDWQGLCQEMGFDPNPEANNGLLYMNRSWTEEYKRAEGLVAAAEINPRIAGTIAFNLMLRWNEGKHERIPSEYSVIWWDWLKVETAKVIQFCSDEGQEKRGVLEMLYQATI